MERRARADRDLALARARRIDQQRAFRDVALAGDWLIRELGVKRLGVLGFCLGGTFALDLAAQRSDLAVVSFYGFPDGVPGQSPVSAPFDLADRIVGPVLAIWGEEDYMDMGRVRAFCERLARANDRFAHRIYAGAGHGFLGGLDTGDRAALDAWAAAEQFFRDEL